MNLEERYRTAAASSYVGKVRTTQAADAGAGQGVNFLDGNSRPQFQPGSVAAPDEVQDEFTRNVAGAFRYGGGGKTPASTNDKSYPLSRWLPAGTDKGDTYFTNNRYTTISDVRNAPGTIVHKFSPLAGKAFDVSAVLSSFAKSRISGGAAGPSPSGVNG
jgi:hypothetical protein